MAGGMRPNSYSCASNLLISVCRLTIVFLALLLFISLAVSGCSSDSDITQDEYRKTGQLQDFRNDIDIDTEKAPKPAVVRGTITKTQSAPNGSLVMIKVSSFRFVGTSSNEEDSTPVPPGTEVVIETRSSAEELTEGNNIEALVRIGKATTGMRLVAESVRLEEP